MSKAIPVYRASGAAMLRASTYPAGLELPAAPDPAAKNATEQARHWLATVWNCPEVRTSVLLASPVLGQQIERATQGAGNPRRVHRLVLSLATYLARWQRRPTPFGDFAGVTGLEIGGGSAAAVWGQHHERVVRADGGWLAGIIARLESTPRLLERLPVLANNTATVRGDRIVTPGVPAGSDALLMPPVDVSVRATAPVRLALELAGAHPVPYWSVRDALADRYPTVRRERLDALLTGLVEQQYLVTALWPPMTSADALGHVCHVLDAAHADDLPEVADLAAELRHAKAALREPDTAPTVVVERMRAVHQGDTVPVMADVRLDAQVRLPAAVVREAEGAAAALVRTSAHPYGPARWRDYFFRFRDRYGVGAVVPVLELTADSGLGLPADFLGSSRRSAPRPVTDRDKTVLALIQQAMVDGTDEIVLTDSVIRDLADWQDEPVPPGRIEVCFEVHAPTLANLDRGRFELAITGAPRPASSMAGRFSHLFDQHERQLWADSFTTGTAATAVQLSFAPRRRRDDMLVRCPQLLPQVIPLGDHLPSGPGVLAVAGLGVTIDAHRFHLVELSTGRELEPRVLHALEAERHTPPLARFLAELTTARCQVYIAFDFGTAAKMPFLPGVRYRRTLLAQPRWLLPPTAVPATSAPAAAWDEALAAWQARWRMPDRVALVEGEQRLPLDLTHPVDRQLLRSRLARATEPVELRRAPDPKAFGWLGRPHEVLLALHHQPTTPARTKLAPARPVATAGPLQLPADGGVLHARLAGHPDRFDEILTQHLPVLLESLGPEAEWWFQRHNETARPDADQHLALFVRLPQQHHRDALDGIGGWAARLRDQRLLAQLALTGYQPLAGRYGHGPALDAAHAIFAADSTAALAQIHTAQTSDTPAQALAAASMADIATALAPTEGLRLLCEVLPRHTGPLDAELREAAEHLASPNGPSPALRDLPGGDLIADTWRHRAAALTAYRTHLDQQHRDPAPVLRSLLHEHHLRAVTADRTRERTTERLARACALAGTARRLA
ncbi:lantibiotic dehydratase [Kitasatospora sp. NPDC004669]|uniref:lantibiotic dehydratase n=1 Tax=Kitasatospora sp. NPDC004669 TaxID=3154555 RepID=UPI0033A2E5A2